MLTWILWVFRNLRMILDPSGTLNANVNASGFDLVGSSGIVSRFSSSSLFLYCSYSFLIYCSSYFRSSSAFFCCCFNPACLSASLNANSWTSLNLKIRILVIFTLIWHVYLCFKCLLSVFLDLSLLSCNLRSRCLRYWWRNA